MLDIQEALVKLLDDFGRELVQRAKNNLKGNSTLESSITTDRDGDAIDVIMEEYGIFKDQGVSGTQQSFDTPFSFKGKMPNISSLSKWAEKKGLPLKDGMTYKSLGFVLARSIQKKGIKPTLFLTKPFEKMLKQLDIEEFAEKVMQILDKEIK